MILVEGNLWDEIGKADLLLVTTNSSVKADGSLVMGAGAALQARLRYPGLAPTLGQMATQGGSQGLRELCYGLLLPYQYDQGTRIGAFQTKYHFSDPARPELIAYAAGRLHGWILREEGSWSPLRVALNFPGIGCGGLPEAEVLPLLAPLPDNVFVYKYPGGRASGEELRLVQKGGS